MKTSLHTADIERILGANLTDEQAARAFESAASDAEIWLTTEDLPDIDEMELDWSIDPDLRDAGVIPYRMQRLSFEIVRMEQARAEV